MAKKEPPPVLQCESHEQRWEVRHPLTGRWRQHGTIKTYAVFVEVGLDNRRIYLGSTEERIPNPPKGKKGKSK